MNFRNQKGNLGFGLIEVMLSVGVGSIFMLAMASMTTQQGALTKGLSNKYNMMSVASLVQSMANDTTACMALFSGKEFPDSDVGSEIPTSIVGIDGSSEIIPAEGNDVFAGPTYRYLVVGNSAQVTLTLQARPQNNMPQISKTLSILALLQLDPGSRQAVSCGLNFGSTLPLGADDDNDHCLAADLYKDGHIDYIDLMILQSNFGHTTGFGSMVGDINHDGVINTHDLTKMLQVFGKACH